MGVTVPITGELLGCLETARRRAGALEAPALSSPSLLALLLLAVTPYAEIVM